MGDVKNKKSFAVGTRLKPEGLALVTEIAATTNAKPGTIVAAAMDRLAASDMRHTAIKWLTIDTMYFSNGEYDTKIDDIEP